jgi:hypothetical protein
MIRRTALIASLFTKTEQRLRPALCAFSTQTDKPVYLPVYKAPKLIAPPQPKVARSLHIADPLAEKYSKIRDDAATSYINQPSDKYGKIADALDIVAAGILLALIVFGIATFMVLFPTLSMCAFLLFLLL